MDNVTDLDAYRRGNHPAGRALPDVDAIVAVASHRVALEIIDMVDKASGHQYQTHYRGMDCRWCKLNNEIELRYETDVSVP